MADNSTRIVLTAEDKTGAAFASVKSGLGQLQTAAASVGASFGVALGGAATLAALVSTTKATIDAADELGKLSQKTGFAVESLSALKYAGSLSDVSLDQLATGVKKLSNNMAEFAGKGTGEAADAFRAIGISVKDASGNLKSGETVFGEIADRFAGMEDGAGKTAIAMRLFGKSGADLIPMLNGGSDGLRDMREEAEKMGIVMSKDLAKASEEFNDNLTRLESVAQKTGITLANVLLPSLVSVTETLIELSGEGGGAKKVHWAWLDSLVNTGSTGLQTLAASFNEAAAAAANFLGLQSLAGQYEANAARARETLGNLALEKQANAERAAGLDAFGGKKSPYALGKKAAPNLSSAGSASAGKTPLERMLEIGEKNLRDYQLKFADGEELMRETAEKRAEESAKAAKKEAEEIDKLRRHYESLAGAMEAAQRQAENWTAGAGIALEKYVDHVRDVASRTEDLMTSAFRGMEDALVNFVKTGKLDFRSLADQIISDLIRIQIQQSVTKPLAATGTDWLREAFGNGSSRAALQAAASAFQWNAKGGVYGAGALSDYTNSIVAAPTVFKFAQGGSFGVMGEQGPEAIMPLARDSSGRLGVQAAGGDRIVVQVIESPGGGGKVTQKTENGVNIVQILVEQVRSAIGSDIARGNGPVAGALERTYGLNRSAGAY